MAQIMHKAAQKYDGLQEGSWTRYVCGHCGKSVAGAVIASYNTNRIHWLLCPGCEKGSVRNNNEVIPGVKFGPEISGLPSVVKEAYEESRQCMSVNAFVAAELLCRKLLMHVAVDKGAKEGETFAAYLTYLEDHGYITPPMKSWVDLIRQHGNAATHELETPSKNRAEGTVMLTAELLRVIYEMEHMASKYVKPESPTEPATNGNQPQPTPALRPVRAASQRPLQLDGHCPSRSQTYKNWLCCLVGGSANSLDIRYVFIAASLTRSM